MSINPQTAVIVTFDRTEAFDKALLAGWEIVGSFPSTGVSSMPGAPPASTIVVLRGHVTGCDGGVWDSRGSGELLPEKWFE